MKELPCLPSPPSKLITRFKPNLFNLPLPRPPPPPLVQAILVLLACLCLCCCMLCLSKKDSTRRRNSAVVRLEKMEDRTAVDDDGNDEVSELSSPH